jgi:hypothetical protein
MIMVILNVYCESNGFLVVRLSIGTKNAILKMPISELISFWSDSFFVLGSKLMKCLYYLF